MRKALAFLLLILLAAIPASAREGQVAQVRTTPVTQLPGGTRMATPTSARSVVEQTEAFLGGQSKLLGPVLNCGWDAPIDAAGTLVLEAGDAAGTAYAPVTLADSLDILRVEFGVLDFGASYPATMAVDFWHRTSESSWDFVVGIDVDIDTNPGLEGEVYDVDVSPLDLRTNNELMVLLSDLNPGRTGLMLPAGDGTQTCFNGTDFCSVVLPNATSDLFLYGITDETACPSAVNNILLFDVAVQVEVEPFVVATEEESFGAVKARWGN